MGNKRTRQHVDLPLPVIAEHRDPARRRNYGAWRAASLILIHLLFAAHVVHWRIAGRTLAPLELNEVMYTLELGVITAGFLFMCLLVVGTAVFGRFFCSWGCHILALQDLCAWLLVRFRGLARTARMGRRGRAPRAMNASGIRAKPIRSRALLWVPPLTALYMFVWPQLVRAAKNHAVPTFHLATDREGWASLVTTNLWRNLPTPGVAVLTFAVCGFLIVYLLGSRTFCTYVCPYGAIFGLADRVAPGRIRVSDACRQCGTCTAVCSSGVRVHEEVNKHGMIVNPACLKDLDCVSACPEGALSYGWGKPSLLKSRTSGGRFGLRYDFSIGEDVLMAGVCLAVALTLRGLYGKVPFLLSLAGGAITAWMTVVAIRIGRRPNVAVANRPLKRLGRVTTGGWSYLALMLLLGTFLVHSVFVRFHEYTGLRIAEDLAARPHGPREFSTLARRALGHLDAAHAHGLFHNPRVAAERLDLASALGERARAIAVASEILERDGSDRRALWQRAHAYRRSDRSAEAEADLRHLVASYADEAMVPDPPRADANQALAEVLLARADFESAAAALREAVRFDPRRGAAFAALGAVKAELGRWDEAVELLRRAVDLDPDLAPAHYNLGTILARLGRYDEAIAAFEDAARRSPDDANLRNNLAHALLRRGDPEAARRHAARAVELEPEFAAAHFNLALALHQAGFPDRAERHAEIAARLDSRYRGALDRP